MANKNKNKIPFYRRFLKLLGVALLSVGIVATFVIVWSVSSLILDAYSFDITKYKMDVASIVYSVDQDGNSVEYEQIHSDTRRLWATINHIPYSVQKAAVAIEDERFYTHQGMDLKRTAGAILGFVTGNAEFGGSTITQQLIKNVTDEWDQTPTRKLREIFRALVLETQLEKDEILEYYLNIVYFGNSSYGVQMASHTYFGKDVSELTLPEAASIIGITQSPATFDPFENPKKNKEKQEIVLSKMLELNYISKEEYETAVAKELNFVKSGKENVNSTTNSYFTEALVKEVANDIAAEQKITIEQAKRMVYTGGLKIYSTVEANVQEVMEDVFSSSKNIFPKLPGNVQPEAAMIVISPENGAVRGMVGGVGKKTEGLLLNRAVDTFRQPGSSIKPITAYGPAVELNLLSPGSMIVDEPFEYNGWKPNNWYKGFKGNVTMREAVTQSMNIPAIKTVQSVGIEKSFDFAKNKLGLQSLDDVEDKNLAPLALGGLNKGVSVKDITAAYGVFANKGNYIAPYMYTNVVDRMGKVVLQKKVVPKRVFSEDTAYLMTSVLKSTAEGSLGSPAQLANMVSAGKTGSTNDDKDRWYIAYTPYYLGGVWYGYDTPKTLPYNATRIVSHKLWKEVMTEIHKKLPSKNFDVPKGIEKVNVCKITGDKAVVSVCPTVTEEFKRENVPKKFCNTVGHPKKDIPVETPEPTIASSPSNTTDNENPVKTPPPSILTPAPSKEAEKSPAPGQSQSPNPTATD